MVDLRRRLGSAKDESHLHGWPRRSNGSASVADYLTLYDLMFKVKHRGSPVT